MVARTQRHKGFSLLEVMVVVAILGILGTMAATFMVYGSGRARMDNAAFEVASVLSVAQIRATSTGVPHYAIFYQEGPLTRLYLLERRDELGPVDWTLANLSNDLTAVGGAMRDRVTLTRVAETNTIAFADLDSAVVLPKPLPQPFAAIPVRRGSGGSDLGRACSFCIDGAGTTRGVIRFNTDGTVRILTGGAQASLGGVIGFTPTTTQQRNIITRMVVISVPAGIYRVFGNAQ